MAGKAIRSLSGVRHHIEIHRPAASVEESDPIPPAQRSRFAAHILAGKPVTSVELPPPRSCDLTGFLDDMVESSMLVNSFSEEICVHCVYVMLDGFFGSQFRGDRKGNL